jgi:hypothetical protein
VLGIFPQFKVATQPEPVQLKPVAHSQLVRLLVSVDALGITVQSILQPMKKLSQL